jgi:LPS-assembly protein
MIQHLISKDCWIPLQYGAQHNIPITFVIAAIGPITLSPSVSYEERWYGQKPKNLEPNKIRKVDTFTTRILYRATR